MKDASKPYSEAASIRLPQELAQWLDKQKAETGRGKSRIMSDALRAYKLAHERNLAARSAREGPYSKKEQLLQHIRELDGWEISCEAAGVSEEEAAELQADAAFMVRVAWARAIYCQRLQQEMRTLALEGRKFAGLLKILEAKDSDYGRLKAEKIQRELAPFLKRLPGYLVDGLGEAHRQTIEQAFERFTQEVECWACNYT